MLVNSIIQGAKQKIAFTNAGYFQYPEEVEIPANVTQLPTNAGGFYNHSEIRKITFSSNSNFTGANSTSAFYGCTGLESISLPDSMTMTNTEMFKNCTALEEIEIPSGVTVLDGYAVFSNCTSLKKVEFKSIPNNIGYLNTDNGYHPFRGCTAIEQFIIPVGWDKNIIVSTGSQYYTNVLTHDSLVAMIAALYDYSGGDAHTLMIGATNLARLSADEIAAATAKNWTVS